MVGIISLMLLGGGALAWLPPETLAAWFPTVVTPVEPVADTAPATLGVVPRNLASHFDSLPPLPAPSPALQTEIVEEEVMSPSVEDLPLVDEAVAANESVSAALTLPPADPTVLQGPEWPALPEADNPEIMLPVDTLQLAHQPAYPGEKWIEVNVTTQQVTAWEGNTPVLTYIVSTGLPNTPTVLGEFNIYWKLEKTPMSGPGYYLPDVPYTMYFYGGYALHGTYWHENFGQPMSHGCVNLETENAKKLFDWADPVVPTGLTQVAATADNPGTLVVVHD
jgi:lipoprotein-anchoring transpeptidase ErfK/SrfK